MWARRVLSTGLIALLGCARSAAGDPVHRDGGASRAKSALPVAATTVVPMRELGPWVDLLRSERFHEALDVIETDPKALEQSPGLRYAASVAHERVGNFAQSARLLDGLEMALPSLADRVQARRARAALGAKDYRVALDFFAMRADPSSRLSAAEAQVGMGDQKAAVRTLSELLLHPPKRASKCGLLAPARRLLSDALPTEATFAREKELRWLALQAPGCDGSDAAFDTLMALPPLRRPLASELLARVRLLSEAGDVVRVERDLGRFAEAKVPLGAGVRDALTGYTLFQARSELERASQLLAAAAPQNAERAAEWLFYSARAQERAGAMERAMALFDRVRRTYPKSPFAELAEYRSAQLAYASGAFDSAARAYDAYLARYGKGARFSADAADERAVAWLISGRFPEAVRALGELAKRASDRRVRARYRQLEGVALLRAGDAEAARQRFREVIREHPLSFAALAARARLDTLGETSAVLPASTSSTETFPALDVQLPAAAELLHRLGLDREAESALGELEASVARAYPNRGDEALCRLYSKLTPSERGFRVGQRAASKEELDRAPHPNRFWVWDCVYPKPYFQLVSGSAAEVGIEPALIYAVMRQESAFRTGAVSSAQAVGLLQLLPSTASRLAKEFSLPYDARRLDEPATNLRLGARYLRKLLDTFGGSLPLAVAAYNAGPRAVTRWSEGKIPLDLDLFVARIPYEETRTYVERVIGNYARYTYLTGGESAVPKLALALPTRPELAADAY